MKMIHEMRNQQPWQQKKSAGPLPIILGAVIAFGIGLLGMSGVVRVPTLLQAKTQMVAVAPRDVQPAKAVVDTTAQRLGNAENAALLKTCAPLSRLGFGDAVDHSRLYRMLQTTSGVSRVAAMTGFRQNSIDDAQIAAIWADVADGVYRQNGWMLCDPDNRALAAETASTFIRQSVRHAQKADMIRPWPDDYLGSAGTGDYVLQNAASIKGRVLSGIRAQVSEGRLTAKDFGMLVPTEIAQIARETTVARDACADGASTRVGSPHTFA